MKAPRFQLVALSVLAVVLALASGRGALAQSGFDDDRVMLQGFYWESYRHGTPAKFPQFGDKKWYEIVRDNATTIRDARFDLVWLPPPCYAGDLSAGYNPKQYFKLDNSYGDATLHRSMLESLLNAGVEPVADVVINHRDGNTGWVDFVNPSWGLWSICGDDEAFSNPDSGVAGTPMDRRGQVEEYRKPYNSSEGEKDYAYGDFRDIDHTDPRVRRDILKYLMLLKSAGYRGWRYDMVHGYQARHLSLYNKRTNPSFSVGEYDWDKQGEQRGWSWATATTPNDPKSSSNVFDFNTQFTLKDNKSNYKAWAGFGGGTGLMGDTTDGHPWKQRAVTFLENQDTGYRTNDDGSPQQGHSSDSFSNNWEVEQAYAYILTHPGVPCVYWKHYFEWGSELKYKIRALINARKVAGVTSGSPMFPQRNALDRGVYAATVVGSKGLLYVRVGGSDGDWQPFMSNQSNYQEYAYGAGWKVWVKLPGNPAVQQAPTKPGLPIPTLQSADRIVIPAGWEVE